MIQLLRETVTDLRDRLIAQNAYINALNIYLDPDMTYKRQVDEIFSYATECQLAGVKLDRVIWERLLEHATAYRDSMRAHPPIIKGLRQGDHLRPAERTERSAPAERTTSRAEGAPSVSRAGPPHP